MKRARYYPKLRTRGETEMLQTLLTVALIAVCPLMMLLMMRGMHGGNGTGHSSDQSEHVAVSYGRIAELEREITALRARESNANDTDASRVPVGGRHG
jgi:Protein of unknown function (DUF2933)